MCKEGLGGDVWQSLPLCPFHCRVQISAALSRQSVRSAMER
jgi:hypothetical protein